MSFAQTSAATIPIYQIPVGKVIEINGLKFIKTGNSEYMAIAQSLPVVWRMQDFTAAHCAQLPMPACVAANNCTTNTDINSLYTQGPTLTDARDGRMYEIRKYADGQCWMADDLKFGGTTSSVAGTPATLLNNYCTGQSPVDTPSTIIGNPNPSWFNVDENGLSTGTNLRGMCYNAGPMNEATGQVSTGTTTTTGEFGWQYASANSGYFYDWGAATQDAFTAGAVGSRKVQGICPSGWHLPASDGSNDGSVNTILVNDFAYLDKLYGGTGINSQTTINSARTYFWGIPNTVASLPTAWKGTFPGCSGGIGCTSSPDRSVYGLWWTSGSASVTHAWRINVSFDLLTPQFSQQRSYGWQVRCVAD